MSVNARLKKQLSQLKKQQKVKDWMLDAYQGEVAWVKVELAEGEKCSRCWNYSISVGQDKEEPEACSRCAAAIK